MKDHDRKKLVTLSKINIAPAVKSKLRLEAKRWIRFIKEERGELPLDTEDYGNNMHYHYHTGEISFIEFFFNIENKKERKKK